MAHAAHAAHTAAALALFTFTLLVVAEGSRSPGNDARLGITGGRETTIEKFPYQVALLYRNVFVCGGSILNARFILTAAHCLFEEKSGRKREKSSFAVRAGSTSRQTGGQLEGVANMASDSRYSTAGRAHDAAVLKLVRPLRLGVAVKPVPLVAVGEGTPRPGLTITLSGWGSLHTPPSPMFLHTVDVSVTPRHSSRCTVAYQKLNHPTTITDEMFCAAARGKDSCEGDSGGPAVDKRGKQVGIVSFGVGCADPDYDGVYTNLANRKVRRFIDYALRAL